MILGRGRHHYIIKFLKLTKPKNSIENYHIVLARKRSRATSRLALFGRLLLTKGSFYKLIAGDLNTIHFFSFDYKRFYKLLISTGKKKIEIHPFVKALLGITSYAERRWSKNKIMRPVEYYQKKKNKWGIL